jgi:UDP-N-acetylmuramoyl-tripeptide--D-alanyl-D-alanine ligase
MLAFSPRRLAHGLGARIVQTGPEADFTAVGTDTRSLERGALFVALEGKRPGESFFGDALAVGARALAGRSFTPKVRREARRRGAFLFAVPDGLEALQALAADQRRLLACPVIAVTGSNGKTSTKDMLAHLLGGGPEVLATKGNFNNHLGVPLTLLRARPGLEAAVVEAGMNHPGELTALGRLIRPDVALELNVGDAHCGHFSGGRAGVAAAKEELLTAMGPSGIAVVNADDPLTAAMGRRFRGRVASFGTAKSADLRLKVTVDRGAGGLRAVAQWNAPFGGRPRSLAVALAQGGPARRAQVSAALAAALVLGGDARELEGRLAAWRPSGAMRQELRRIPLKGGKACAILDAYNASPQSMAAALAFLELSAPKGRRTAVLGCMLELGEAAPELHRALGREARARGVDRLAALGVHAPEVVRGFGGNAAAAFEAGDVEGAAAFVRAGLKSGDWCLFKGSRGLAVERVFQALLGA